jgi:hypothetical protein
LNLEEDDGYTFNFKKGKWMLEEWNGEYSEFEYKNQKEGLIESENSKLKEVYKRYLSFIEEEEMDIVKCWWTDYRMSEKKLIELMEKRIKGEKIELPEGY